MANILFCIFCDSLKVFESYIAEEDRYEYNCKDCYETWADDESEFEAGI